MWFYYNTWAGTNMPYSGTSIDVSLYSLIPDLVGEVSSCYIEVLEWYEKDARRRYVKNRAIYHRNTQHYYSMFMKLSLRRVKIKKTNINVKPVFWQTIAYAPKRSWMNGKGL